MVSESYQNERNIENNLGDFGERFQQLTREVLNQRLDDVKTIGEKTYVKKDKNYITWCPDILASRNPGRDSGCQVC